VSSIGAYRADRAAALSGVPLSTVRYWASHEILEPSVSAERVMLWSFTDLLGLRLIYWLRQHKDDIGDGVSVAATTMSTVRKALDILKTQGLPLLKDGKPSLWVDTAGRVFFKTPDGAYDTNYQTTFLLDLIQPFSTGAGLGPNLFQPRPTLRIVPGKLTGAPHVAGTRLETRALYALAEDGLEPPAIRKLYPFLSEEQVQDSLSLEKQLRGNVELAA
jgi:uncharacterized protein (DUF433 family)